MERSEAVVLCRVVLYKSVEQGQVLPLSLDLEQEATQSSLAEGF